MTTGDYNPLDWLLIVIIGGSVLFGFRAGLVRVVIGFAAGALGILMGLWFYETPASYLSSYFESPTVAAAIGFLIVFAGVVLAGGMIARVLGAIFKWAGIGWLDRLMGAAVGFLRGMMVAAGIVMPLLAFSIEPTPAFLSESRLAPYTIAFGRLMVAMAPVRLRDQFDSKANGLKSLWQGEIKKALPGFGVPGPAPGRKDKPEKLKKESY